MFTCYSELIEFYYWVRLAVLDDGCRITVAYQMKLGRFCWFAGGIYHHPIYEINVDDIFY